MTVEQIEKIAWLNRAFYAEKKIKALEYHKERDKERATKISATYNGAGSGKSDSRNNSVEDVLITLAESDEKYKKALIEYNIMRREIQQAIDDMCDPELEAIFIYRYLEYMSMDEISETMHYERKSITRKHKIGLDKMSHNVS